MATGIPGDAAAGAPAAEAAYREAFAALPAAAFLCSTSGVYLDFSEAAARLIGRPREELVGRSWRDVMHPDDVEACVRAADQLLRGEVAELRVRKRFAWPQGASPRLEVRVVPVRAADGEVTCLVGHIVDLVDELGAVQELQDVRERFRTAFEDAPIGAAIATADGRYLDVNSVLCEMLGRERDELLSRSWHDVVHPDDVAAYRRQADALVAGEGRTCTLERRYLRPDGGVVWAEESLSIVRGESLRPSYLVTQAQDVTARRTVEEALAETEARLQATFERAPIGMALLGADGRYRAVNRAFCAMVGYPEQELLRLGWTDLTPPDDLALELADPERTSRALSDSGHSWQKRYVRRDGAVIWVDITSYGVYDAHGSFLHQFAQYQDVTEQRRVAEALRASEERFRIAFESSPVGMALRGPDGRRLASNPALERLTGFSQEELAGFAFGALTHPDDVARERAALAPLLAGEVDQVVYERRLLHRSGEPVSVEVVAALVRAEDGALVYVLEQQTDVGERRRLERQLQHASKLEAIGRLAGGIAHDFNNMLLVIRGYTHLLLQHLGEDDPSRADAAEIDLAAERAARLVAQLLAFGRRQLLQPRVLDLNEVVHTAESLARRIVDDPVTLRVDLAPSIDPVRADPGQLEQVILNLVINARDALPDGGGTITISTGAVRLGALAAAEAGIDAGRYSVLAVADDGVGMDAETAARAVEPFFTTKAVGSGTGLGLATVHGIVTQSGGGIAIDTSPGRGTVVTVYLPPAAAAEAPSPSSERAGVGSRSAVRATRGESVVVVEDDVESRALVVRVLAASGYRVASFASPVDALDWLDEAPQQVDALVTDVAMPGMRGPELVRRVLARHPQARAILVSGFVDGESPDDLSAPGVRFLAKPFAPADLLNALAEALADGAGRAPQS